MPQPITHYLVIEEAMHDSARDLWTQYRHFAGFGSFGPDLFYLKDLFLKNIDPHANYDFLSDNLHIMRAFDFYCAILGIAKTTALTNIKAAKKQLAYALGYYAHVITDCVIHPYVYRRTHDHWKYHKPEANYNAHKRTEALIDCHILKEKGRSDVSPGYYAVTCGNAGKNNMLDLDIATLLLNALKVVYPDILSEDFFTDVTRTHHPIHVAYHGFRHIVGIAYTAQNILYCLREYFSGLSLLQKLTDADMAEANELHDPWLSFGRSVELTYAVSELFSMAVYAVKQVIEKTLAFWNSTAVDAKSFFLNNVASYLGDNWNLDTGLPDRLNNDQANLALDDSRYDFGIDILLANYANLLLPQAGRI